MFHILKTIGTKSTFSSFKPIKTDIKPFSVTEPLCTKKAECTPSVPDCSPDVKKPFENGPTENVYEKVCPQCWEVKPCNQPCEVDVPQESCNEIEEREHPKPLPINPFNDRPFEPYFPCNGCKSTTCYPCKPENPCRSTAGLSKISKAIPTCEKPDWKC